MFDLFGFVAADQRRIRKGVENSLKRFQRGAAETIVADLETLNQYAETIAAQLSVSLPDVKIVTGFRSNTSHLLLEVRFEKKRGGPSGAISSLEVRDIDWNRLARDISPQAETTALMAEVGGMLFAGDTVFIVKTNDAYRWSYDAALDDADRLFSALAFGGDVA